MPLRDTLLEGFKSIGDEQSEQSDKILELTAEVLYTSALLELMGGLTE